MKTHMKKIALAMTLAVTATAWADNATSAAVMAPLEVNNWSEFENQLASVKSIGVTGVSVDVWWGKVEANGDQQFDWSYYDTIFQKIENAGLHIIPIMSFHQCGGNVGDDCNIPIPSWIWNKYTNQGVSASDLKYKSEYGNESVETVSLWRDDYVLSEYKEFMEAFEAHYASKANLIDEVNVSMGPAGELRYPSYNAHDGGLTGYPTRGGFQAYSEPAKQDFRNWAIAKYGSVSGVSNNWGVALNSANDINPPSNAGSFINNGDQYNTAYGRDFIRWYHDALMDHGYRMMDNAILAFDGAFANVELGFKIPGIHWKMSASDNTKRSAEMAAGLIPSDVDLNSASTGYGYGDIVGVAASYNNHPRDVVLHFTALEMNDDPNGGGQSLAQSLVFWVANEAAAQGVSIKGENALSGGVTYDGGWDNIVNAFTYASYSGMTVLRINQVASGTGNYRYQQFINQFLVEAPNGGDWQRTVIFMFGTTTTGQDMFIRGGLDHNYANTNLGKNCSTSNYECAMPIRHNNLRNSTTAGWKGGDQYLDWYGIEASQGSGAVGTALDWTTNNASNSATVAADGYGYEPLNTYGDHYWMLDVEMDCSATVNGWFELKSYISNGPGWEADVAQAGTPYNSGNHFAQCGKINVFQRNSSSATIGTF
ncbi:family 14 glycosylhydrolase [Reinekea marina]|uniref:Beta-amylase n=1 Tax=Reinekea marina TaxID=1310421 RepID=A0ABV7WNA5_9GAMM|nr:family 14 glycosylhydrolase [Reinekea marina]MDN3647905.1 family 14 glycosylhydrolase [Reinekea marina]